MRTFESSLAGRFGPAFLFSGGDFPHGDDTVTIFDFPESSKILMLLALTPLKSQFQRNGKAALKIVGSHWLLSPMFR